MADELFNTFDKTLYRQGSPLYQGDGTPLTDISNIAPSTIGDGFSTGGTELVQNYLQSANFETGVQGWQLTPTSAEFQTAIFNIGGTIITIDNTQDIQTNIDIISNAGGGTLYLQPGTYTLTADISIPSGVTIEGVSRDNVIIDCNSSYAVKVVGTNAYTTGTVALNDGDTTVVGSGTTFTSDMVGQSVFLDGQWYVISAFTNTIHITIADAFFGSNLSGYPAVIADQVIAATLRKLTITNATGNGLAITYAQEPVVDDLYIYGCGTGMNLDYVYAPLILISSFGNGINADFNYVTAFEIRFSAFDQSTSSHGFILTNCNSATFFDSDISGNTGDGANLTNCVNITFVSFSCNSNGGQGVELVSGNSSIQLAFAEIDSNTSDGIKLTATSDYNSFTGLTISNNGGYGINIAASTCDNNQIISPAFSNNTSGNINDSGTNTTILPNTPSFTAAENLTIGQPVGLSNIVSNNIARAVKTVNSVAHGITTPLGTVVSPNIACSIGGDKFVYLQYTAAGTDTLFAQVGSIDRTTNALTLGTAVSVSATLTPVGAGDLSNTTICKLDTDKFIVFWLDDASTTIIKYRVGTVLGTSITFPVAAATASTAASTVATSKSFSADFLSTDKGVFCYKAATTTSSKIIVFTVSGTTATFGTEVTPGTNSQINTFSQVKKIGTDKFVLVTPNTANSVYGQVSTCVGTTQTTGSELQLTTATSSGTVDQFQVVSPATDVFVVRLGGASGVALVQANTVSTRTITNGTAVGTESTTSNFNQGGIYAADSSTLYIFGARSSVGYGVYKMTLSGTALTAVGFVAQVLTTAAPASTASLYPVAIDNGYVIAPILNATNVDCWIQGMSNNFIGIVQATVNRGGSVSVLVSGQDGNQSGLTAGAIYQVSGGALVFASTGAVADNIVEQFYVKAVSPTQIII